MELRPVASWSPALTAEPWKGCGDLWWSVVVSHMLREHWDMVKATGEMTGTVRGMETRIMKTAEEWVSLALWRGKQWNSESLRTTRWTQLYHLPIKKAEPRWEDGSEALLKVLHLKFYDVLKTALFWTSLFSTLSEELLWVSPTLDDFSSFTKEVKASDWLHKYPKHTWYLGLYLWQSSSYDFFSYYRLKVHDSLNTLPFLSLSAAFSLVPSLCGPHGHRKPLCFSFSFLSLLP